MKIKLLFGVLISIAALPFIWTSTIVYSDFTPLITRSKTYAGDTIWTVPISPYHSLHPYVTTKIFPDKESALEYKGMVDSLVVKTNHQYQY